MTLLYLRMRTIILAGFYILSSFQLIAQVPVSREPRHHVVFENDKVRILNVLLPPGDTTQYHVHSTPSLFISFTKTNTSWQRINEQPVSSISVAGYIWFENLNPPHIKIHRVWNMDTSTYHVMDVELLAKDSGFSLKPLAIEHVHLLIDTPWVRTYTIKLAKNEEVTIKEQQSNFILVAINDAIIKVTGNGIAGESVAKPGQFYWIKAHDTFAVINRRDTPANFALLEIK
jgi:hypothetical protein